jgi:lysophospholipase L1-like esterase
MSSSSHRNVAPAPCRRIVARKLACVTIRIVSIGDSFTEGMNDYLPDGTPLGWADRVAAGLAAAHPDREVWYANFAIRGRKIESIVTEQLDSALALDPPPTHLTFNGGGNDMLRPGFSDERMRALTSRVLDRCAERGVEVVILTGANPSDSLPAARRMRRLGAHLTDIVEDLVAGRDGVFFVNNFGTTEGRHPAFWSEDRLHLTSLGHQWIASRVLTAMGVPTESPTPAGADAVRRGLGAEARYWRTYVVPWMGRRLRGRSSGDGREPKFAAWTRVPGA